MADGSKDNVETPSRPRLVLKPRDEAAAKKLEAERQASSGKSPFGEAKPRERVIAEREGKAEDDVVKEDVKKEKLRLRLSASQLEEKRAHEAAVKEIEEQIEAEEDESKKEVLRVERKARQEKLDSLIERFAKTTLETALSGEAPRVSQMRKAQVEAIAPAAIPPAVAPVPMAVPPQQGNYNPRYNPTQHYAGPGQHPAGGGRGGARGFKGYVPRGGRHSGRGRHGGGRHNQPLPEWAKDEYAAAGGASAQYPYDRNVNGSGGYVDTTSSDQGFYDRPAGSGSRGRGRGRGRSRYYNSSSASNAGYYGAPGGQGVGGEIQFDTFAGQDRY